MDKYSKFSLLNTFKKKKKKCNNVIVNEDVKVLVKLKKVYSRKIIMMAY